MKKFLINRVLKNADRLEKRAAKMRLFPHRYAGILLLTWVLNTAHWTLKAWIKFKKFQAKKLARELKERQPKDQGL